MAPLPVLMPSEGDLGSFASSFAFRRNINPLTVIPKTTKAITFNSLRKICKTERAECKLCFYSIVLTLQDCNQSEVLVPTSELKCDTMQTTLAVKKLRDKFMSFWFHPKKIRT